MLVNPPSVQLSAPTFSVTEGTSTLIVQVTRTGDTLRLFPGRPDPNDATRFTLPYELLGHRNELTGIVQRGGRILLTPHEGSTQQNEFSPRSGHETWNPHAQP